MPTHGYCLCRKTSWSFSGPPNWQGYCHCDDCRRNCAAPIVGWLGVPLQNFRWTATLPRMFESSPGVFRYFCGQCGSPFGFEADHYPGDMHLYAASLENPEAFTPAFHLNYQSRLPWLSLNDDLPKHDGTALQASPRHQTKGG